MSKSNFHIFRKNDYLKMQKHFIFVDTETKNIVIDHKTEKLTLKLGWAIYWNRQLKITEYFYFITTKDFWNWVMKKLRKSNNLIMYAHNMDFDFKVLDGYNNVFNIYKFKQENFYIEGKTFIITASKEYKNKTKNLYLWDTLNYAPNSLYQIGESVGIPKTKINFKTCSNKELSIYCKNDVTIVYEYIKQLINFLEKYNLSKLKPTVASLSINIFRHNFYNKKDNPLYIHKWNKAIELERDSYKGGISDCLKVGKFKKVLYKLDINSMYPFLMKKYKLPSKLIYYSDLSKSTSKKLFNTFNKYKEKYLSIINCDIFLPKSYAYILARTKIDKQIKSCFLSGYFRTTLTTPEIDFVLKHGKIIKIYAISLYKKSVVFKPFVDFFYNKKVTFKKQNKKAFELFSKYILNSLYGKFGQTDIKYIKICDTKDYNVKSVTIFNGILDILEKQVQFGNEIFSIRKTDKNSFDTLVAIPSFITSYARMYLVELILKAKRKNTYYIDTDCLVVNKEGLQFLNNYLDKDKLGMLKIEGKSYISTFYRPKFYIFNDKQKCKGIRHTAKLLKETNKEQVYEQLQFERFKSSINKDHLDSQFIYTIQKIMSKNYDKGIVKNKNVIPFYINKGEKNDE